MEAKGEDPARPGLKRSRQRGPAGRRPIPVLVPTASQPYIMCMKVKYADFHQITRSKTCDVPVASQDELDQISFALLETIFPAQKGIRLLGVTLSSLGEELHKEDQLRLSL